MSLISIAWLVHMIFCGFMTGVAVDNQKHLSALLFLTMSVADGFILFSKFTGGTL